MSKYYNLQVSDYDENEGLLPSLSSKGLKDRSNIRAQINSGKPIEQSIILDLFELIYNEDSLCQIVPDATIWKELYKDHIIISDRFRSILSDFNLKYNSSLPCLIKSNGIKLNYFLIQLSNSFEEQIDFSKSEFIKRKLRSQEAVGLKKIKVKDFSEYKTLKDNIFKETYNETLGFTHAHLKYKNIDFFSLPSIKGVVISERLKDEIINQGITGVKLKELNDITFSFD